MAKHITAKFYTRGKFGKRLRETVDTDNPYLYSLGRYPTKIKHEDLPNDYIEFHSRSIWYMTGYLKTSGVVDIGYTWARFNHLFKDDYVYLSYKEPLKLESDDWGFRRYTNYDVCICGNDIIDIVLAVEKHSNCDTSFVRSEIEKKRIWLRDNEPDYYADVVGEDRDLFDLWSERG